MKIQKDFFYLVYYDTEGERNRTRVLNVIVGLDWLYFNGNLFTPLNNNKT